MRTYEEKWQNLTFKGFDQKEYAKKSGAWKNAAMRVCESLAVGANCGVVADTAAGKTIIALLPVVALEKRTLFPAPQRLLSEQHDHLMRKMDGEFFKTRFIHGSVSRKKRVWNDFSELVVFATPQTAANDIASGKLDLTDFGLVAFDEMHRASGNYPYVNLARIAHEKNLLILGLTASPGWNMEKIDGLKKRLFLEKFIRVEVETPGKSEMVLNVDMDQPLVEVDRLFKELIGEVSSAIREFVLDFDGERISVKKFEEVESVMKSIDAYKGAYLSAKYRKLRYAYMVAMTEGYRTLLDYLLEMERGDTSKSAKEIIFDPKILSIVEIAQENSHPKTVFLFKIISSMRNFGRSGLVFIGQKSTGRHLSDMCKALGWKTDVLFGGRDKNIARQKKLLEDLSAREIDFLFCTSVAEEGISIPEIDAVIQYSMPMTEVARIQRGGRTGRMKHGSVIYIALDHPFDNNLYFSSRAKARNMRKITQSETIESPPPRWPVRLKKKSRKWVDEHSLSLF